MDFINNAVKSSNAIIKDKVNKIPFNNIRIPDMSFGGISSSSTNTKQQTETSSQSQDEQISVAKTISTRTTSSDESQVQAPEQDPNSNAAGNKVNFSNQLEAIAADAQVVRQKTVDGAKNIKNFILTIGAKAGQTVSQTASKVKQVVESTTMSAEFTKEQQEFIRDNGSMQASDVAWADINDDTKRNELKEQILNLSQDKRNFVRSPPNDANFEFDTKQYYPVALCMLREDPNLGAVRNELVPKLVNEETFWRNYFFRIHMVKKMNNKEMKSWSSSRSSSGEGPDLVESEQHHNSPNIQSSLDNQQSLELDSKKVLDEADDLKSKLKELNIGSFEDQ